MKSKLVRREVVLTGGLTSALLVLSILVYVLFGPSSGNVPMAADTPEQPEQLAKFPWTANASYQVQGSGVIMTVHAFRAAPDSISIVYSLYDSLGGRQVQPDNVSVTDDLGYSYPVLSHAIIGSFAGVTAGVLISAPYRDTGDTLTLQANGSIIAGSTNDTYSLALPFIKRTGSGTGTVGGRVAPEVVRVGDVTLGLAGPPGGRFVEVLVSQGKDFKALRGLMSGNTAETASDDDFSRAVEDAYGLKDLPPPPDFPTPSSAQ